MIEIGVVLGVLGSWWLDGWVEPAEAVVKAVGHAN